MDEVGKIREVKTVVGSVISDGKTENIINNLWNFIQLAYCQVVHGF